MNPKMAIPGVVHHDVQPSEPLVGGGDRSEVRVAIGDIGIGSA